MGSTKRYRRGGTHLGHRGHLGSLSDQSYLGHLSEEEEGSGVTGHSSWGELLDEGLMLEIAVVRGLLSIGVNLWVNY